MMEHQLSIRRNRLGKIASSLRRMTDEELLKFGKDVRRLAENRFRNNWGGERRERNGREGGSARWRVTKRYLPRNGWRVPSAGLVGREGHL